MWKIEVAKPVITQIYLKDKIFNIGFSIDLHIYIYIQGCMTQLHLFYMDNQNVGAKHKHILYKMSICVWQLNKYR